MYLDGLGGRGGRGWSTLAVVDVELVEGAGDWAFVVTVDFLHSGDRDAAFVAGTGLATTVTSIWGGLLVSWAASTPSSLSLTEEQNQH